MRTLSVTALLCLLAAPGFGQPRSARELLNVIQTRHISVEFKEASLKEFLDYVRAATGINIVVNKARIAKDGGDADGVTITLDVKKVTVLDALKLALLPHDIGLATKGNVLLVTSHKAARGKPVLQLYNVADVLMQIRDFPAPDINIHPSNYEPPEAPEPEVSQAVESADELAELIRQFTGQGTWEDEGIRLSPFRKHIFVRQYPHVHREIARFLAAVRGLR